MKQVNKQSKMSYSTRLLLIIATLAAVGSVAIFFIVNFLVRDILYDDLINTAERDISIYTGDIEAWFSTPFQTVHNLKDALNAVPDEGYFESIIVTIAESNDFIENIFIGFADGSLLNSSGWRPNPADVGEEQGGVGSGPWPGWSSLDRPWYIAALEAGEGTIVTTEPYVSFATGNTTFAMATWIPELSGIGAVVGFSLSIDILFDNVRMYEILDDGYLILVGDHGEMMIHPDERYAINEQDGSFVNVHDTVYSYIMDDILRFDTDVIVTYREGLGEIYIVARLIQPVNWVLISVIPTARLEAELRQNILIIMTPLFILLVLLFVLVAIFTLRLTRSERETRELNEIFLTHSPLVMNIWENAQNMISTSRQAIELFELDNMEQYIERFFDLSPEYQPCGMLSKDKAIMNNTRAFEEGYIRFDWMHQKLDGEPIPTEIIMSRFTRGGKPYVAAFTIDLRLAKTIHDKNALEAEWNRLQSLFDSAPFGCAIHEIDYSIIDINSKVVELLGISDKEEYFDDPYAFYPDVQPDGKSSDALTKELVNKVLREGFAIVEWWYKAKDETLVPCEVTLILADLGERNVIMAWMRDLRDFYKHKEVRDRMEKEQVELMKKLEDANAAKSRFLSNMSHEIRTPMNAIIGMTGIAKSTHEAAKKDDSIEKIERASIHLLGIVNQILDISKIEADEFKLYPHTFRFKKLIDDVLAMLSVSLEEKQLSLKVELDEALPEYIVSDEIRLAQVITNLLTNAIKFTPNEGRLTLVAKYRDIEGSFMQVTVTDTGIGIPKELHDGLFDDFFQVESVAARRYSGTGLGLTISKWIVEMMGGSIWVESEPDKGSNFTFLIPVIAGEAADEVADIAISGLEFGNVEQGLFKGRTILVAEDVEINREIVAAILELTEVDIEYAHDGEQVVRMFAAAPERYDLILMDVQMPGMDGMAATRAIRDMDMPIAKNIPIVAMTANVFREDIDACIESGMNDHLGKPLDLGQVIAKLKHYLKASP